MIELTLPFPPSVNTYWRHPTKGPLAGRHLISEKGRAYRDAVGFVVAAMLGRSMNLDGRLSVEITAHAPDKRKRDLDNLPKGILDALTHAGVWLDDSAIDRLCIRRGENASGGRVVVKIEAITAQPSRICHGCGGAESKPLIEKTTT